MYAHPPARPPACVLNGSGCTAGVMGRSEIAISVMDSKRRCFKILLRHTSSFPACCRKERLCRGGGVAHERIVVPLSGPTFVSAAAAFKKFIFFLFLFCVSQQMHRANRTAGGLLCRRCVVPRKGKQQESFCLLIQKNTTQPRPARSLARLGRTVWRN